MYVAISEEIMEEFSGLVFGLIVAGTRTGLQLLKVSLERISEGIETL